MCRTILDDSSCNHVGTFKVIGEIQVWFSAHGQPCYIAFLFLILWIHHGQRWCRSGINRITKAEASNDWQMKSYTAAILLQTDEEKSLMLLFLIFLVNTIAGSTNNIIAAAAQEKEASSNNIETKSPAAFIFLLRLNTYVCIYCISRRRQLVHALKCSSWGSMKNTKRLLCCCIMIVHTELYYY